MKLKISKTIFKATILVIGLLVFVVLFNIFYSEDVTNNDFGTQTNKPIDYDLTKQFQKLHDSIPNTPENKDFKEFVKEIKPVSKFNYCNCIPFHAIEVKNSCQVCRLLQKQCYKQKTVTDCTDYYKLSSEAIDCIEMNKVNWWYKENTCQLA